MATEVSLPTLTDFLNALRFEGIPIGPHELVWLQHAFAQAPELDRRSLKNLLASTLIKNPSQRETFDTLFDSWCPPEPVHVAQPTPTPHDNREPPASPNTPEEPSPPGQQPLTPTIEQFRPAPPPKRIWTTWQFWGCVGVYLVLGALAYSFFFNPPEPIIPQTPIETSPQSSDPESQSLSLPFTPVDQFWTWVPQVTIPPLPLIDTFWLATSLGLLSLLSGTVLLWRYRRQKIVPEPEDTPSTGPQWFPLPDLKTSNPELLDREALRTAVWGVERFVSEDETSRIHVDNTVTATAAAGGMPSMRFELAVYPREVWLWQDTMAQDATINRLVEELAHSLSQAGLPIRVGSFVDTPALVQWREGQEFSPLTLEGHRQSALVLILTDGYGMQLAEQNALEQTTLSNLLRAFGEWPRLTFVDVGDGEHGLARQVQSYGLSCIAPQAIPEYLGAQTVQPFTKRRMQTDLFGDLRAWAAATALSSEPVTAEHAFAVRDKLGLSLSPWGFRDLLHAADGFDDRLAWQQKDKAELLNWLVQCSKTNNHVADTSPLAVALDYWIERYQEENQERNEQHTSLLPWRRTPAEQRVRMETALLELWRTPEEAAKTLYRLRSSLGDEVEERLDVLADWSKRSTELKGVVYLPWTLNELPTRMCWMLGQLGFGAQAGLPEAGPLHMPASLLLVLGLSAGMTLAAIGVVVSLFLAPKTPVLQPFLSPPFQVIQNLRVSGPAEYRLTIGTPKQLQAHESILGNSTVQVEWTWKPQDNRQPVGNSKLWYAGTLAQPIRGCEQDWPARSLAIIQADPNDKAAGQLVIRLLDTSSADAVLLGEDWRNYIDKLVQVNGSMTHDQQLMLIVPPQRAIPDKPPNFQGDFEVVVAKDLEDLAKKLNFPGMKRLHEVWGDASTNSPVWLRGGPEEETDKKTGITFVKVCGGTFTMGMKEGTATTDWEKQVYPWASPQHSVTLDTFEISKTETTNGQYQLFEEGKKGKENLPVANVSWNEAKAFCEKFGYTLPTEAEWEYAARGGSTTRWSFGDDDKQLGDYAWFTENSERQVHPVQDRLPNPLGLHDMHGNVWEWVEDCFDENAYKNRSSSITNPLVNPGSCERRVLRGGSFVDEAEGLRSADRFRNDPEVRDESIGFRCVRRPRRQP